MDSDSYGRKARRTEKGERGQVNPGGIGRKIGTALKDYTEMSRAKNRPS